MYFCFKFRIGEIGEGIKGGSRWAEVSGDSSTRNAADVDASASKASFAAICHCGRCLVGAGSCHVVLAWGAVLEPEYNVVSTARLRVPTNGSSWSYPSRVWTSSELGPAIGGVVGIMVVLSHRY